MNENHPELDFLRHQYIYELEAIKVVEADRHGNIGSFGKDREVLLTPGLFNQRVFCKVYLIEVS